MSQTLNIEESKQLIDYLLVNKLVKGGSNIKSTILKGGVSNRTVLVTSEDGNNWVLKQCLEKLRVKGDWFSNPDRIFIEAEAIRWFEKHTPSVSVPKLIFEDQSEHLLAMEAIAEPFDNLKTLLLTTPPISEYFYQAGEMLGTIHKNAFDHKDDIPKIFKEKHFFQTLRIEPYYLETRKVLPETESFFDQLISDTLEDRYTLTHGDFSPKNMLVKDSKLILLDHEVMHFGDGTFDVGFFTCHLLSKANHLPNHYKGFGDGVLAFFNSYTKVFHEINKHREERCVKHAIGCLLARVSGLSPLEYLNSEKQTNQKEVGLKLIKEQPKTMEELIFKFNQISNANN